MSTFSLVAFALMFGAVMFALIADKVKNRGQVYWVVKLNKGRYEGCYIYCDHELDSDLSYFRTSALNQAQIFARGEFAWKTCNDLRSQGWAEEKPTPVRIAIREL